MATRTVSKKSAEELQASQLVIPPIGGLSSSFQRSRDIDVAPELPSHYDDRLSLLINPEVVEEPSPRNPFGLPIQILKAIASLHRFGLIELRPIVKTGQRFWISFRPTSKIDGLSAEEKKILFDLTRHSIPPESPFSAEALPEDEGREIRSRLLLIFGEGRNIPEAQAVIRRVPNVRTAEPPVRLYAVTATPIPLPEPDPGAKQVATAWTGWGREMVQVPTDFDDTFVDSIAVLDSGVDKGHPLLAGGIDIPDWVYHSYDGGDQYGHGTHVCSIIAARAKSFKSVPKGIVPNSKILSFNIFRKRTDGNFEVDMDAFYSALYRIRWTYSKRVRVINLSIWMKGRPNQDILDEFARLESKGIVVVACATNQEDDRDLGLEKWKDSRFRVQFPARLNKIFSVGAVDNKSVRAPFSCYSTWGPDGENGNDSEAYLEEKWPFVDVMAPGIMILGAAPITSPPRNFFGSTQEGIALMRGTSMAAPYVTAAIGYLRMHEPWKSKTAFDVRRAIRTCIDDKHVPKIVALPDTWETLDVYGFGVLNCQKVLDLAKGKK